MHAAGGLMSGRRGVTQEVSHSEDTWWREGEVRCQADDATQTGVEVRR